MAQSGSSNGSELVTNNNAAAEACQKAEQAPEPHGQGPATERKSVNSWWQPSRTRTPGPGVEEPCPRRNEVPVEKYAETRPGSGALKNNG